MKGEGLLDCLKRNRDTKNKWITVYQAAQACPRSNDYIRDMLEEFADKLPEVDRKEECSCKTLYYVDPPDEKYGPPKKGNHGLGMGVCLASLLSVGVAALACERVDTKPCTQCGHPIPVDSDSVGSEVSCPKCGSIFEVVDLEEV